MKEQVQNVVKKVVLLTQDSNLPKMQIIDLNKEERQYFKIE